MRTFSTASLLGGLGLVLFSVIQANAVESRQCSSEKLWSLGKAYSCLISEDRKARKGRPSMPESCHENLVASFSELEASGLCNPTGDVETAYSKVVDPLAPLFDDLLTDNASSTDPLRCAEFEIKTTARYASCAARLRGSSLRRGYFEPHPYWAGLGMSRCDAKLRKHLVKLADLPPERRCIFNYLDVWNRIRTAVHPFQSYFPNADFVSAVIIDTTFEDGTMGGADFSNAELLSVTKLTGSDLSGANFSNTYMTWITADGADFSGADFSNATIAGISAAGANFAAADLSTVTFDDSTPGASMLYVHAIDLLQCPTALPTEWFCRASAIFGPTASLDGADLTGVDLHEASLSRASFREANLTAANLAGADLSWAILVGANLSDSNLAGASMLDVDLGNAVLDGADMTGADLSSIHTYIGFGPFSARNLVACPSPLRSDWRCINQSIVGPYTVLDGLNLSGIDLSGIGLYSASLEGTNLTGANLGGADLRLVHWSATICPDGVLSDSVGGTCCSNYIGSPPAAC